MKTVPKEHGVRSTSNSLSSVKESDKRRESRATISTKISGQSTSNKRTKNVEKRNRSELNSTDENISGKPKRKSTEHISIANSRKEETPFSCEKCGLLFKDATFLSQHKLSVHSTSGTMDPRLSKRVGNSKIILRCEINHRVGPFKESTYDYATHFQALKLIQTLESTNEGNKQTPKQNDHIDDRSAEISIPAMASSLKKIDDSTDRLAKTQGSEHLNQTTSTAEKNNHDHSAAQSAEVQESRSAGLFESTSSTFAQGATAATGTTNKFIPDTAARERNVVTANRKEPTPSTQTSIVLFGSTTSTNRNHHTDAGHIFGPIIHPSAASSFTSQKNDYSTDRTVKIQESGNTGLFGSTSRAFAQSAMTATRTATKFIPLTSTDTMEKKGVAQGTQAGRVLFGGTCPSTSFGGATIAKENHHTDDRAGHIVSPIVHHSAKSSFTFNKNDCSTDQPAKVQESRSTALFGFTAAQSSTTATGTATKFTLPVTGTDVMQRKGVTQSTQANRVLFGGTGQSTSFGSGTSTNGNHHTDDRAGNILAPIIHQSAESSFTFKKNDYGSDQFAKMQAFGRIGSFGFTSSAFGQGATAATGTATKFTLPITGTVVMQRKGVTQSTRAGRVSLFGSGTSTNSNHLTDDRAGNIFGSNIHHSAESSFTFKKNDCSTVQPAKIQEFGRIGSFESTSSAVTEGATHSNVRLDPLKGKQSCSSAVRILNRNVDVQGESVVESYRWYKVTLYHVGRYNQYRMMRKLKNHVRPVLFTPFGTRLEGGNLFFFVDNKTASRAIRQADCKLKITARSLMKIKVQYELPIIDITTTLNENIARVMSSKYNDNTQHLDLSKFHGNEDFIKQNLLVPLNIPNVALAVFLTIDKKLPKLKSLDLSNNNIYLTNYFSFLKNRANELKSIDLSGNRIKKLKDLRCLEGLKLNTLVLYNNPLCNGFERQETYVRDVRKIFSTLLNLDGFTLSPPDSYDVERTTKDTPLLKTTTTTTCTTSPAYTTLPLTGIISSVTLICQSCKNPKFHAFCSRCHLCFQQDYLQYATHLNEHK